MSASEFEAYTTGKTLTFLENGQAYGAEEYKPGREVIWSFLDGECQEGTWYAQGKQICFVYEGAEDTPQCWEFYREGSGLRAIFAGEAATELFEALQSPEPLVCLGPEIGV